jgi:phytoene synthase
MISSDQQFVVEHVPHEVRPAFEALFELDAAMGDVVARATQPALGAIKLAWWRERLQELDRGIVPAEPRLRAAADHLLPRSVSGADLAELEAGWAGLLQSEIDEALVAQRGAILFRLAGRLLGSDDPRLGDAGALYALVSVARRGVPELLGPAKGPLTRLARHRFPRALRPLTALARLAARDLRHGPPFEDEGIAPRLAAMLRHRWSGVVTRGD